MPDGICPAKVIVLTLERAKARQARIKSLLDSAGIPFEFFWGVDGQMASAIQTQIGRAHV